jgi:hypothetical protein
MNKINSIIFQNKHKNISNIIYSYINYSDKNLIKLSNININKHTRIFCNDVIPIYDLRDILTKCSQNGGSGFYYDQGEFTKFDSWIDKQLLLEYNKSLISLIDGTEREIRLSNFKSNTKIFNINSLNVFPLYQ